MLKNSLNSLNNNEPRVGTDQELHIYCPVPSCRMTAFGVAVCPLMHAVLSLSTDMCLYQTHFSSHQSEVWHKVPIFSINLCTVLTKYTVKFWEDTQGLLSERQPTRVYGKLYHTLVRGNGLFRQKGRRSQKAAWHQWWVWLCNQDEQEQKLV